MGFGDLGIQSELRFLFLCIMHSRAISFVRFYDWYIGYDRHAKEILKLHLCGMRGANEQH